jgi:hypothetical protein
MRIFTLSDIKAVLQDDIYNIQRSIINNVTTMEDYWRLVGKLHGFEAAIAALEDEATKDKETDGIYD